MTGGTPHDLNTIVRAVSEALHPFVNALINEPSFVGTAVFFKDGWHQDTAGILTMVYASKRSRKQLAFSKQAIASHRVALDATTLGETFAAETTDLTLKQSRMNPHHTVWGVYMKIDAQHEFVVQSAFDLRFGPPPLVEVLVKKWHSVAEQFHTAVLPIDTLDVPSLSDSLELDVPTTPNAYVIKWDVTQSTRHVQRTYPAFRTFANRYESAVNAIIRSEGGIIASYTGDGQNIVLPLPADVDPNNLEAIQAFEQTAVRRLVKKLTTAHSTLPRRYPLRFAVGAGYVESSHHGEATGPIFWKLSSLLKRMGTPKNTLIIYQQLPKKASHT